ncbi:MAG: RHS repeat-associated core domain-containing protein [Bacteroidales bacterium]|nr:RHS repeat-associated core domain-containing protein [Bacteroidales bacterium]
MRKTVNGNTNMYYVLTDYLGSIDAVLPAVSGVLPVVEYYSYDAWGNRRDPSDWSLSETRTTFITDRGYTGHEMLDEFDLINANGRIYEPSTGRFLSPDNYVQAPGFSQSFNRYAYGFNNPTMFTDPDGELAWIVPVAIGMVVGAEIGGTWADNWEHWAPWNWSDQNKSWKAAWVGAMYGGLAGSIVSAGLGLSGTGFGQGFKAYANHTGPTNVWWDMLSNGFITANSEQFWNQIVRNEPIDELFIYSLSGFFSGAIGGFFGNMSNSGTNSNLDEAGGIAFSFQNPPRYRGNWSVNAIRTMNFTTSVLNTSIKSYYIYRDEDPDKRWANTITDAIGGSMANIAPSFMGNNSTGITTLGPGNQYGKYLSAIGTQFPLAYHIYKGPAISLVVYLLIQPIL